MTYQEQTNTSINHFKDNELPFCKAEKQRIGFLLDEKTEDMYHNKRLPAITDNQKLSSMQFIPYEPTHSLQRLPSPYDESSPPQPQLPPPQLQERMPPTANEIQYIKRIQALMTLVSRQTKEIHSLREIIAAHNNNNQSDLSNNNRKRNKQS
ncbi:hypothetical protein BDF21DRAFT_420308 [Thamnidium elegans]|nr:hypothetical protein BDF21DRAFT_420308 [Thamnidium elegans]